MKAEELGARHVGSLNRAVSELFLVENLLLKISYKSKNPYGGTPEPHTTHDAPWLHEPSLSWKKSSIVQK